MKDIISFVYLSTSQAVKNSFINSQLLFTETLEHTSLPALLKNRFGFHKKLGFLLVIRPKIYILLSSPFSLGFHPSRQDDRPRFASVRILMYNFHKLVRQPVNYAKHSSWILLSECELTLNRISFLLKIKYLQFMRKLLTRWNLIHFHQIFCWFVFWCKLGCDSTTTLEA